MIRFRSGRISFTQIVFDARDSIGICDELYDFTISDASRERRRLPEQDCSGITIFQRASIPVSTSLFFPVPTFAARNVAHRTVRVHLNGCDQTGLAESVRMGAIKPDAAAVRRE